MMTSETNTQSAVQDKGYHHLLAWQEAHRLVLAVYSATESFPRNELFGLTSQMRRAAVSVAANIVEGQARKSKAEFAHFLSIANGSLTEVEYYCEVARDLGFLQPDGYDKLEAIRYRAGYLVHGLAQAVDRHRE
jgi:four helix bundle protein